MVRTEAGNVGSPPVSDLHPKLEVHGNYQKLLKAMEDHRKLQKASQCRKVCYKFFSGSTRISGDTFVSHALCFIHYFV